jgi:hypothetical protein
LSREGEGEIWRIEKPRKVDFVLLRQTKRGSCKTNDEAAALGDRDD